MTEESIDINEVKVSSIDKESPLYNKLQNDDIITKVVFTDQFNTSSTFESTPVRVFNQYLLEELSFAIAPNSSITIYFKHGRNEQEQSVSVQIFEGNFVDVN